MMKIKQVLFGALAISLIGLVNSNLHGWCFYVYNNSHITTQVDPENGRGVEAYDGDPGLARCNNMWTDVLKPGDKHEDDCTRGACNSEGFVYKIVIRALDRTFTIPISDNKAVNRTKHKRKNSKNREDIVLHILDFKNDGKWKVQFNLQGTSIPGYQQDAWVLED
jgi:hypothetical protein